MITINLLPIDKRKKAIGRKPQTPFILTIIFIFIAVGLSYFYFSLLIKNKKIELANLKTSYQSKEATIKDYRDLEVEIAKIKSLLTQIKATQSQARTILDSLRLIKENTPQEVILTGLSLTKIGSDNIVIAARASSPRIAALYRERIAQADWVEKVELGSLTISPDESTIFNLEVTLKKSP